MGASCICAVLFLKIKGYYVIDIWDMIFHWTALALIVASCSTPDFVQYWGRPGMPADSALFALNGIPIMSNHVKNQVGLMTWQISIDSPNMAHHSEWQWIQTNCQARFKSPIGMQSIVGSCSTYNSFRATLIIGTCCYGLLVALRTIVFLFQRNEHKMSKVISIIYHCLLTLLGASSFLLPIANWIMYKMVIDDFNKSNGSTGAENGASGALLTLGWFFALFPIAITFIKCCNARRMDEHFEKNKIHEPHA